jgi:hypothetical protein
MASDVKATGQSEVSKPSRAPMSKKRNGYASAILAIELCLNRFTAGIVLNSPDFNSNDNP